MAVFWSMGRRGAPVADGGYGDLNIHHGTQNQSDMVEEVFVNNLRQIISLRMVMAIISLLEIGRMEMLKLFAIIFWCDAGIPDKGADVVSGIGKSKIIGDFLNCHLCLQKKSLGIFYFCL